MTMGRSDYDRTNMGMSNYADQLIAGSEVYGSDNDKIGTIADVGQNYFLVQKGWLFIKDLYLPTSTIARVDGDKVYLNVTKDQADQMATDTLPAAGDAWYGTDTMNRDYAETATTTDRMTTDRNMTDRNMTGREVRDGETVSVPVVEEQLKAGVRETEAGRARIVKDVREEQQSIDVPVEREEVFVTERAVNRPATQEDLNMLDRDIEVPLREQEVVVQKQAMVTGEVQIRKEVTQDTERVTDTVRREDVHVEGANSDRIHVEGLNADQQQRFNAMSREDQRRYADMSPAERARYDTSYTTGTTTGTRNKGEGIIDRAKDKVRDEENRFKNR